MNKACLLVGETHRATTQRWSGHYIAKAEKEVIIHAKFVLVLFWLSGELGVF